MHIIDLTDRNVLQTRSSKAFFNDDISIGARSLPETPIISSTRRSDVEYFHHGLSFQVNKENCNEEFGVSSGKIRRGKFKAEDEIRGSPRHYAKHIVKKVKESVSRRVGLMDVTNTKDNKLELKSTRRDENLSLLKHTKKIYSLNGELSPDGTPSCSPRLRFLETNKLKQIPTKSPVKSIPFSDKNPSKQKSQVITPLQENQKISRKLPPTVSDQAIRNKKEESFVRSNVTNKESLIETKANKASLWREILNIRFFQQRLKAAGETSKASKALGKKSEFFNKEV